MSNHRSALVVSACWGLAMAASLTSCGADQRTASSKGEVSVPVHVSSTAFVREAPPSTVDELADLAEKRASDDAFAGRLRAVESSAPSDHQWSVFVTTRYRDHKGRRLRCIVVLQRTPPPPADLTDGLPALGGTGGGGQCAGMAEDQVTLSATGAHAVVVSLRPGGPSGRPIRLHHSRPAPGGPRVEALPASYRRVSQDDDSYWLAVVEPPAASLEDEVSIAVQP